MCLWHCLADNSCYPAMHRSSDHGLLEPGFPRRCGYPYQQHDLNTHAMYYLWFVGL